MPPRHQTLPPAQTSSARAALQSFYCDLCAKGYSRMNDYEAHLGSYDHSHRQRMKDMKQMLGAGGSEANDSTSGNANEGKGSAAATGFKKGGFKKSGFKSAFAPVGGAGTENVDAKIDKPPAIIPGREDLLMTTRDLDAESDTDDEGYEVYNPRFPTD
ncbi:hypothetical protein E0Z10_g1289 [Xylaria hypoxylon]|uniref:C2H2-type domain-containing protein n=1 Tax=Xylaria hypoxylon TaxID=37992 RepID=A0A4Z0Z7A3_9PEZI|nr:hypothetical protein E0Z10_g1289 [Xylaria hypoxylon]